MSFNFNRMMSEISKSLSLVFTSIDLHTKFNSDDFLVFLLRNTPKTERHKINNQRFLGNAMNVSS